MPFFSNDLIHDINVTISLIQWISIRINSMVTINWCDPSKKNNWCLATKKKT